MAPVALPNAVTTTMSADSAAYVRPSPTARTIAMRRSGTDARDRHMARDADDRLAIHQVSVCLSIRIDASAHVRSSPAGGPIIRPEKAGGPGRPRGGGRPSSVSGAGADGRGLELPGAGEPVLVLERRHADAVEGGPVHEVVQHDLAV